MKRDMDLIRTLLLEIEVQDKGHNEDVEIGIEGFDASIVEGHLRLLKEAGLIDADEVPDDEVDFVYHAPTRLTWNGHEFLDTIRDQDIWDRTQEGMKQAGGFSLDLAKALAKGFIKKNIERYTGVELDL
jgi:hypothetical protein